MCSTQKGFAQLLIILTLTVLAIGGTTFLISVTNPNLVKNLSNQVLPASSKDKIQTTSNEKATTPSQYPTPATSISNPQKNAFQVLKDKILTPKSNTPLTNNTSQTTPTNIDTSKEVSRHGSPASTPKASSKPVNPEENVPIYYK